MHWCGGGNFKAIIVTTLRLMRAVGGTYIFLENGLGRIEIDAGNCSVLQTNNLSGHNAITRLVAKIG